MACLCAPLSHCPAIQKVAADTEKLSSSNEGRMALHKVAIYTLKFFQEYLPKLFNNSCAAASRLIMAADSLIVGTMMFSLMGYFGFKKAERPHLEVNDKGQIVKNLDKTPYKGEAITQFQKDAKDRPFIALANINYLWTSFTMAVSILESCSLKILSTVSNGLGAFGSVGRALGNGVTKWFFFSGNVCLAFGSAAMVLHRAQHIVAHCSDKDFQTALELKLLAARMTILALDVLSLASRAVPCLAPIGIIAGLAEAWSFLKLNESTPKSEEAKQQDALYKRLHGGAK